MTTSGRIMAIRRRKATRFGPVWPLPGGGLAIEIVQEGHDRRSPRVNEVRPFDAGQLPGRQQPLIDK